MSTLKRERTTVRASGSRSTQRSSESADIAGVRITHPQKPLWPRDGITKLELARYYAAVGPTLLRYAGGRPLTLRPFPRGVDHAGFYLKDAPGAAPAGFSTFCDVAQSTGQPVHFLVPRAVRDLVWLAQFNAVEVHPWLSTVEHPDQPDWLVVDLDPPAAARWAQAVQGAFAFKERLESAGLQGFPKLSGSTGLHLLVPLVPEHDFETVREFVAGLAAAVQRSLPDALTLEYDVADRGDRVLVDYAQNARAKNTVAPYSVRPKPGAPVAAPVTWDELRDPDLRSDSIRMRSMSERLQRVGDLLEPALRLRQRLPRP